MDTNLELFQKGRYEELQVIKEISFPVQVHERQKERQERCL